MKENAYGFSPGKKAWQAIARVHRQLTKEGKQQVMDADLKEYFDRIPHDQLMKSVARRISDGRILADGEHARPVGYPQGPERTGYCVGFVVNTTR